MNREEYKEAIKEALHEWLDAKFAEFGKWTFRGVLAAVLFGGAYLYLVSHGWKQM